MLNVSECGFGEGNAMKAKDAYVEPTKEAHGVGAHGQVRAVQEG